MVCIVVMLPKGENRRFVLQLYVCAFLMCVGDALAGAFCGQESAGAAVAVHAGNKKGTLMVLAP